MLQAQESRELTKEYELLNDKASIYEYIEYSIKAACAREKETVSITIPSYYDINEICDNLKKDGYNIIVTVDKNNSTGVKLLIGGGW
jgi:hypothetical protein